MSSLIPMISIVIFVSALLLGKSVEEIGESDVVVENSSSSGVFWLFLVGCLVIFGIIGFGAYVLANDRKAGPKSH
jgi:hypothetical protein